MNATKIIATIALAWVCQGASACDATQPRCVKLNRIVERLGYLPSLAAHQATCLGHLAALNPDDDLKVHPGRYYGMRADSQRWVFVRQAYEMFLEQACGPETLPFLLTELYRQEWDKELPGEMLDKVSSNSNGDLGKALGAQRVDVEREVGAKVYTLVGAMAHEALSTYAGRVKAIADSEYPGAEIGELPDQDSSSRKRRPGDGYLPHSETH